MYNQEDVLARAKQAADQQYSLNQLKGLKGLTGPAQSAGCDQYAPTPRPTMQTIIEATIGNLHRAKEFNRQSRTKLTGPWPEANECKTAPGQPSIMELLQSLNDLSMSVADQAREIADLL